MGGVHQIIGRVLLARQEGAEAFAGGLPRAGNPHDPSSEEWMCWRDGWEQAKAAAASAAASAVEAGRSSSRP